MGLILGMKRVLVPVAALGPEQNEACDHSGDKRDAEVNRHAAGDAGHRDPREIDVTQGEAQQRRDDFDEEPRVDAVKQDLEDAVEGDKASGIFGIAVGQSVPHDDHRDAAGQADHDQADHELRVVVEEEGGEGEHEDGADDPVLDEREAQDSGVAKDVAEFFVADFGQRGNIMRIRPMAMGMLVVPNSKRWMNSFVPGRRYPRPTPAAMARKIQSVR